MVIGQIISLFGNAILRFALPLYLLDITGSSSYFGLVSACSFLPMILMSPIGGIIADRVNKRNIMVILDFTTAAITLLFALLMGKVNLILLIIITLILLYGIQGTYQPAVQASIPVLASQENLLSANAVINQVSSLSGLLGPVIGGLLYGSYGLFPILLVGIFCFFCSAVMEIFIRIPHNRRKSSQGIIRIAVHDLKESLHFVKEEKPVIWKVVTIVALFNLFLSAMLIVGLPVLIKRDLGISDQLYGYSQGALAAGGLFGGVMVGILKDKLRVGNAHLTLFAGCIAMLPMGLVFLLPIAPFYAYLVIAACSFVLMMLSTMFSIQMLAFIQRETPDHLIGKVISCVLALAMCAQPLGQAIYGVLFDVFRNQNYLILFGAALICGLIAAGSGRIFASLEQSSGKSMLTTDTIVQED